MFNMSISMLLASCFAGFAILSAPVFMKLSKSNQTRIASRLVLMFTWGAVILSSFMTLLALAAAAWGMDTRVPWGLGIYPYLIPILSLPALLLLKFASCKIVARVFWSLTLSCGIAWSVGDRAVHIASGLRPISEPREVLGMFLNAFTLMYAAASVLVQMAAFYKHSKGEQS